MRKESDKNAANPNSGSIWTTRVLLMAGNHFLFGLHAGSFSLFTIVKLCILMVIPWMTLFRDMMIYCVILLLIAKRIDWSDDPRDQELGDDHSCAVLGIQLLLLSY
jgi:hypothetical protein